MIAQMNEENRNMILAVVLSMLVLLGWYAIFPPEQPPQQPVTQVEKNQVDNTLGDTPKVSAQGNDTALEIPSQTLEQALKNTPRVDIQSNRVQGSLSLRGARIDDLRLLSYNVKLNDPSEKVTLLSPAGTDSAYYVLHGFSPAGGLSIDQVPTAKTLWSLKSGDKLTPNTPIVLEWDNGQGLVFERTIRLDERYMFAITQSVTNNTGKSVTLAPYGQIIQTGPIKRAAYGRQESSASGVWILHEGIVLYTGEQLEELDYSHMPDEDYSTAEQANIKKTQSQQSGWIGFTSKYWMTTLIPDSSFTAVSKYNERADRYQAETRQNTLTIDDGGRLNITSRVFAGAKNYDIIRNYRDNADVAKFTDSIDWGWFFFFTEPIFLLLNWLYKLIGNMGWAIIVLTLIIKAALFPLAYRSYVSMARMKNLQPEMEKLKEKHDGDRQALQQDMIKLYREKKVNPAAGCLPILVQIPIFFSLYKVIFVTLELRHAPFIGWLHDLSAPDPSSILNLFGLLPWGTPDASSIFIIFSIGVWPVLMGISMWLQQKLNPAPTDEVQAKVFAWLPWVFMFMLGGFASGLVLYWVANNMLTFMQQYIIMRSQGMKPDIFGNILAGLKRNKAAK